MTWFNYISQGINLATQAGGAVVGIQTQRANLETAKAQKALAQSQMTQPAAPAVSPYIEPKQKTGGIMGAPMLLAGVVVLALVALFAFMRKGG